MDRTKRPPSPLSLKRARVAVSLVFVVNGAGVGLWVPQIPVIRTRLGLDSAELGVALLSTSLGAVMAMPLVSQLIARRGSRVPTIIASLCFCAVLSLPVRMGGFVSLLFALLAFGLANGAMDVAMNVQASRVESEMGRPVMSSFHGLFSLGSLIGAALSSLLLARGLDSPSILSVGTLSLLPVILVATTGLLTGPEPRQAAGSRFVLPPRGVLALGLLAVIGMMSEGAVADWSGVFLTTEVAMSVADAALTFSALSLVSTLGRLFVGDRAVHAWGRRPVLVANALLAASGVVIAVAAPGRWTSPIGLAIAWLGLTSFVPILFSAAGRRQDVSPAVAMGAVATLGYIGFLLGPPLIGFLAQSVGLRTALLVIPAACLGVALVSARKSFRL
ncbi:MAG TPA: MFS transporter [Polyangiaceae bacterium]|nr:MFS transporter [Polyangiaceae bacterium]